MALSQNPTDHARTTHQRAGEWFKNSRDAPGLVLLAVGVVAMVISLAVAAHGDTSSAVLTGSVAMAAGGAGTIWLFVEGRRVGRVESKRSAKRGRRGLDDHTGTA
jgi:protein-S-isoprenylcysteine O-methyltransferase Ste14